MSFTYDPTIPDYLSNIRFLIDDTDPDGYFLQDEEITFVYEENDETINKSILPLAKVLRNRLLKMPSSKGLGSLSISYNDRLTAVNSLISSIESQANPASFRMLNDGCPHRFGYRFNNTRGSRI